MKFRCPKCKKGVVREEEPGVAFDIIGEGRVIGEKRGKIGKSDWCIARSDLVCDYCETEFNIFFQFDRVEDKEGEEYEKIEELRD